MHLTKTTTRALAVSAALVVSAGSIAGAAVFHLPILGLDRTEVASAQSTAPTTARPTPDAHRAVTPRKIVKTRYVNDIVHIPAPAGATLQSATTQSAVTLSPVGVAPVAPRVEPAPAPEATTSTTAQPAPTSSVPGNDDSHADRQGDHEHSSDAAGLAGGSSDDGVTSAPTGDQ